MRADKTGNAIASALGLGVSQLRLYTRVSTMKDVFQAYISICSLPGDAVLVTGLNSDWEYERARAISLPGGRISMKNTCTVTSVRLVAFDERSDTLLLIKSVCNDKDEVWTEWLMSLQRSAKYWIEVQRLCIGKQPDDTPDFAVCESRVFLGPLGENHKRLEAYDVSAEHKLRPRDAVVVRNEFEHFACTRLNDEILVACSHAKSVSLHRLVDPVEGALELESLSDIEVTHPYELLFRRDLLLVVDRNDEAEKDAIESFLVTGGRLVRRRRLLDSNAGVVVAAWCTVSDQLVILDEESNDLLVYVFE